MNSIFDQFKYEDKTVDLAETPSYTPKMLVAFVASSGGATIETLIHIFKGSYKTGAKGVTAAVRRHKNTGTFKLVNNVCFYQRESAKSADSPSQPTRKREPESPRGRRRRL